jgi:HlyD family secretion protein
MQLLNVRPAMNRVAVTKLVVLAIFSSTLVAATHGAWRLNAEGLGENQWRAVAPGRIEPAAGEIKLMSAIVGRVADILVSTNDQVFAGELLIRLDEADARARLSTTRAQFAMQKRARNDEAVSGKAAQRRKAEDAVADAENDVFEAQSALDLIAIARRRGMAPQAAMDDARTKLARMQDQLRARRMELRKLEAQSDVPLPTQNEGQFNVARAELSGAQAALEKTHIRAPIDGRVLKVNAKPGEIVGPSSAQPLLLFGDVSRLQIRAEVDEADFSEISFGEAVVVRATAFPDREFSAKVSFVSPMVGLPRINTGKAEDTKIVEVFAELSDPGPLAVGMKLDVYFMAEGQRGPTH